MVWNIYQSNYPTQRQGANDLPFGALIPSSTPVMCQRCNQLTSHFLTQCANAVKDAGQKPDDQIWLAVFGGLKQMLEARERCAACREAAAAAAGSLRSPVASRLASWRTGTEGGASRSR